MSLDDVHKNLTSCRDNKIVNTKFIFNSEGFFQLLIPPFICKWVLWRNFSCIPRDAFYRNLIYHFDSFKFSCVVSDSQFFIAVVFASVASNWFQSKEQFYSCTFILISLRTKSSMYLHRNIEASSCNHCCSVKAICIAYSECVSVALVVQHALHVRHVVICGLFGLNPFPHYLINGTIFEKEFIEHKMRVLIFSTNFSQNIFSF
jgi:hypothetical protein